MGFDHFVDIDMISQDEQLLFGNSPLHSSVLVVTVDLSTDRLIKQGRRVPRRSKREEIWSFALITTTMKSSMVVILHQHQRKGVAKRGKFE